MIRAILTSGSMRSLRHKPDKSCATKPGHTACHRQLKCLWLRKVDMSVRLGETEPGAAVRRPSDRSADNPGGPAWGGVGRPAPNDLRGLSSGPTPGSSVGARPDPPTGLVGRPVAL